MSEFAPSPDIWLGLLVEAVKRAQIAEYKNAANVGDITWGVEKVIQECNEAKRVILFGNGGSLAIASHIATDFSLVGWPALALTDSVALTSHTNDFGPAANFSKQLELMNLDSRDLCIALSCSGASPNIIEAVKVARFVSRTITMSGFLPTNRLRYLGDWNIYVPSAIYGIVQLAHEAILHMACDCMALRARALVSRSGNL